MPCCTNALKLNSLKTGQLEITMISACLINENDSLSIIQITPKEPLPSDVIWLDVNQPDDEERQWLETLFVEDVPEEDEMDDIES